MLSLEVAPGRPHPARRASRWISALVVGAMALTAAQSVHPATAGAVSLQIGTRTVGTSTSVLLSGYKTAQRLPVPTGGTITTVSAYVDGFNASTGSETLTAAVYGESHGSGTPDELLGTSSNTVVVAAGAAGRWVTFATDVAVGDSWTIWLSLAGRGSDVARTYGDDGAGTAAWAVDPGAAPSDPYGTPNFFSTSSSIYATETVTPTRTVKVMALGDSITDGHGIPGGYRTHLWQRLVKTDDDDIDLVGSLSSGPPELGDKDAEGHSGWCIDGDCYGGAGSATIYQQADGWLRAAAPDIILLHVGTNDLGSGSSGPAVTARLDALLTQIYSSAPRSTVVLAENISMNSTGDQLTAYTSYIESMPGIVAKYQDQGRGIELVDMSTLLSYPADYQPGDGWHPNQQGFDKMADAWYPVVSTLYNAY